MIFVGRISDGFVVASVSAHERVTSLETTDFGYVMVVGRQDGRVLTMKLVAGLRMPRYRPADAADRRQLLLDAENCCEETFRTLDPLYQRRAVAVDDTEDDDGIEQLHILVALLLPLAGSAVVRTDPLFFLAGCCKR